MKKCFLILLLLAASLVAYGKNEVVDGVTYMCDDKYSNKDFSGISLTERSELKNIAICGSNFSRETPNSKVFPDGMTGVTFINCNLDNVFIPNGNTIIQCSQRRFKVQNDGEDWILDDDLKPIYPVNIERFEKLKLSLDPSNIPNVKKETPVTCERVEEIEQMKVQAIKEAVEAIDAQ